MPSRPSPAGGGEPRPREFNKGALDGGTLIALLKALSERQVTAILLEGGPTLAGSFLAAGLIGQVVA